jgi:outer membrane protein insertion porin family
VKAPLKGTEHILKPPTSACMSVVLSIITVCSILFAQEKKYVGEIVFTGNHHISTHELLSVMHTKPPDFFNRYPYELYTLIDDIDKIKNLYNRYGFFDANVRIGAIITDTIHDDVLLKINICENVRTLIDSIIFLNTKHFTHSFLSEQIPLKTGAPFDSSNFTQSKSAIWNLLKSRGYQFSNVTNDLVLDEPSHKAVAVFIIKQGPVIKSGDIEIIGAEKLKRSVILRELDFKEGQILTSENIDRSISNLNQTKLFKAVIIEPLDTSYTTNNFDTVTVPVIIQVELADMFTYEAGGGYNTHDGLYGSIEPSYNNLFSLGHRISGLLQSSSRLTGGQINYYYPWFITLPLSANLMFYLERRNELEFNGLFTGGQFTLNGVFNRQNSYSIGISIDNTVWIHLNQSANNTSENQNNNIAMIGILLTTDTRDNPSKPGKGIILHIQPELAGPGISWSSKFFKIEGDGSFYFKLFRKKLTFLPSISAGFITPYGNNDDVPVKELFTVTEEGIRTIRGYAESEILMPDQSGKISGGRLALVITPLEVVFPLNKQVSGAVFIDGGFIWPMPQDFSINDLRWSTGPGVRINSPVGIIRIDYGIQLGSNGNLHGRLHFGVGTGLR